MKQLSGPDVLAMQAQTPLLLDVREPWEFAFCHHGMRSAQVVAFLEHQGFDAA